VRTRLEDWADYGGESWAEAGLGSVLRDVWHGDDVDAELDDESFEDALESVLDGMSVAEGLSFTNALRQVQSGVGQAMSNPLVAQVGQTALPLGAGALGTVVGGPAGTAIGSRLGTLAAGALAQSARPATIAAPYPRPTTVPVAPPASSAAAVAPRTVGDPGVASGSAAAAQGLVLTQQPDVLKALLALSMGQHGARQVDGVPVSSVMNLLSSVFGQAAADADELAYLDGEGFDGTGYGEDDPEPDLGVGRALYTAFMDAENASVA